MAGGRLLHAVPVEVLAAVPVRMLVAPLRCLRHDASDGGKTTGASSDKQLVVLFFVGGGGAGSTGVAQTGNCCTGTQVGHCCPPLGPGKLRWAVQVVFAPETRIWDGHVGVAGLANLTSGTSPK